MTTASITHITFADPPNPVCRACHTDAHPASAMQPAFCTECVNAMLHGRENRLSADDVPTENPDVDSTPETAGPSPLRRPHCACGAVATIWDEAHYCAAHYLELPAPTMQRLTCKCCQGFHSTHRCPEIAQALFATEATPVVYDTLEMVRLWAVSRTLLVAKLAPLTRPQLLAQAVAFAAWLETRTHAGLKAASVLHIWEQMIEVNHDGPAAPAMRVAA